MTSPIDLDLVLSLPCVVAFGLSCGTQKKHRKCMRVCDCVCLVLYDLALSCRTRKRIRVGCVSCCCVFLVFILGLCLVWVFISKVVVRVARNPN
jgi:hypothetical protein